MPARAAREGDCACGSGALRTGCSWALTAYLRFGRRAQRSAIEYVEAAADDRHRPRRAKRSVRIAPDEAREERRGNDDVAQLRRARRLGLQSKVARKRNEADAITLGRRR